LLYGCCRLWHVSGVRFLRLLPILLAFACGGCTWWQKKPEVTAALENSRAIEQRRMRVMDHGDVTSRRGAEILVADYTKQFDPSRSGVGTARTFGTGGARAKEFNFQQKFRADTYQTRDFRSAKADAASERKYKTGEANTQGKYTIPNTDKEVGKKTATTKELWDGDKVAATQDLRDGKRQYLGPESKKLSAAIDAKELANWRSGGGEAVIYNNGTVERVGTLKQLSIDDVRELLNKNK
jgi:hypothetical protein